MFNENTTKTRTTIAGNRPVVSEYVEVSNELMDMFKISTDDINGQGEAIKDLIKR